MPTLFRNLFDALVHALGGGYDKPQPLPEPPPKPGTPPPAEATTAQQHSNGFPVNPAVKCCVCRVMPAKPEYLNEYCSPDCMRREDEERMADRLDAWHDQFQERFGDD